MADNVPAPVAAAEKTVETDLKQKANVNWLFVAGVAIVANLLGVFLHL